MGNLYRVNQAWPSNSLPEGAHCPCTAPATGRSADGKLVCAAHGATSRVCVLGAHVDWMDGWSNTPLLEVLLSRIPKSDEYVYEKRGSMYFAEREGLVRFFWYDRPGDGFGGEIFTLKVRDSDDVAWDTDWHYEALIGPWSSSAGAMMQAGFPQCIEVSMTDDPQAFARGYTLGWGALTIALALEACSMMQGIGLLWLGRHWVPTKTGVNARLIGGPGALSEGTSEMSGGVGVFDLLPSPLVCR